MKRPMLVTSVTTAALFVTGLALADSLPMTVSALPERGPVTISGTVEEVTDAHSFTLSDDTGGVEVNLTKDKQATLEPGERVTVNGRIKHGFLGLFSKNIEEATVIAEADAVADSDGLNHFAPTYINALPRRGLVEVTGTVSDIEDARFFKVQDGTGIIPVSLQSKDGITLDKGEQIKVIGYVHHNLLGNSLQATHIITAQDREADESPLGDD